MSRALPSFDLVVATIGRTEELDALLRSLERQSHRDFRVFVVDQNDDGRVAGVLAEHSELDLAQLGSPRGLSRARNAGLPHLGADLVAFPDDDCTYPPDLLERVAERFAGDPGLGGLTGRTEDASGKTAATSKTDRAVLTDENLWNRGSSAVLFLRSELVRRIGAFDENLGVGSGHPWCSAEEIDYLVRAIRAGARIEYDPALLVRHSVRVDDTQKGLRDGASVGYVLRKHRYSARVLGRMAVRPLAGVIVHLARGDRARASYYAATIRGRVRGYLGARRSKISA